LYRESLWNLSPHLCILLDEESLKSIVEEPVDFHRQDFGATVKVVMEEMCEDTQDLGAYYEGWSYMEIRRNPLAIVHKKVGNAPIGSLDLITFDWFDGKLYMDFYH